MTRIKILKKVSLCAGIIVIALIVAFNPFYSLEGRMGFEIGDNINVEFIEENVGLGVDSILLKFKIHQEELPIFIETLENSGYYGLVIEDERDVPHPENYNSMWDLDYSSLESCYERGDTRGLFNKRCYNYVYITAPVDNRVIIYYAYVE